MFRFYPDYSIHNLYYTHMVVLVKLHLDLITVLLLFAFKEIKSEICCFSCEELNLLTCCGWVWRREIERMNICFVQSEKGWKPICICLQDHSRFKNDSDKCIWCSEKCLIVQGFIFICIVSFYMLMLVI